MKTFFKIFAAVAALGLAPAAAIGQAAPAAPAPAAQPAAAPAPAAALPAQPSEVSPAAPASGGVQPSDAAVAQSAYRSTIVPDPEIGQPKNGRMGLQEQVTAIGEEAAWFHNAILLPAITIISLFVLILLVWVILRYRRGAHPTPSRTTHNTLLEVVWTLVPVLILVVIAVPSIKLLARQYSPPAADLTVKVIGNQWYWEYEYPDHGVQFVSNILSDRDARTRGEPRMQGVDNRMVVPVGATVKLIITSNDVIHSFGVPAFWTKLDAVPGRLNETWFRTDRPGLYYGQCFELCGARHAYMPVAVEVVPAAQFAQWVASRGGTMPTRGGPRAASPDATATSPLTGPQRERVGGAGAEETSPSPTGVTPGVATPPVTTQGNTNSRRGGSQ
jgi:cytochrome c oxidase subunit 2